MAQPKQIYNKWEFIGLDIETTTFESERISKFDETLKHSNTCYLWGIGLYNFKDVYDGNFTTKYEQKSICADYKPFRTFEELDAFFRSFNHNKYKTICYVHNLGYEIAFLQSNYIKKYGYRNLYATEGDTIDLSSFMGDSPRRPFKLCFNKWPNIEFRCSLKILNDSLQRVGVKFKFEKLKELKTYKEKYFSDSVLPLSEYQYNLRDIDVMAYAVVQTLCKGNLWNAKNVDSMAKVFSSTSFIKKQIREHLGYFGELNFTRQLKGLNPRTLKDYDLIESAYVGGYTHANSRYRSLILKDVYSIDLTSAYPSILVCSTMPTKYKRSTYEEFREYEKFYIKVGFIAFVRFKCLRAKDNASGMCYIADTWRAPGFKSNGVCLNNGKIYSACDVILCINSNQYEIIKRQYDYASIEFSQDEFLLLYDYKMLNRKYIEYIYELAKTKTDLKEFLKNNTLSDEEEHQATLNLAKSKNNLNGLYGTHGMKVIRPSIYIDNKGLHNCTPTDEAQNEALERYQNNYYNMIIASEITTACHVQLFQAIDYLHEKGCKILYSDTDSLKYIGNIDGKQAAKEINKIMREGITNPLSLSFINDFDFLGFDYETKYDYARFLGAKKYLTYTGGKFSITVAGVPKFATNKAINDYAKTHTIKQTFDYWLRTGTRYRSKTTGKLSSRYYTKSLYYLNDDYITDENGTLCHVSDCFGVTLYECDYILNESNYITEVWEDMEAISGKGKE